MKKEKSSLDILGVKGISDSIKIITQASVDGAKAFLSRVCLPAAEEFGLILKDHISSWRKKNTIGILNAAEEMAKDRLGKETISPRIVYEILEKGSLNEQPSFQRIWAGLLVTSLSECSEDDTNLIYAQILEKMTFSELQLVIFLCHSNPKYQTTNGRLSCFPQKYDYQTLPEMLSKKSFPELVRISEHLSALKLIEGGFDSSTSFLSVKPTDLSLNIISRGHGYKGNLSDYYYFEEDYNFFPPSSDMRKLVEILPEDKVNLRETRKLLYQEIGNHKISFKAYVARFHHSSSGKGCDVSLSINPDERSSFQFNSKTLLSHSIKKLAWNQPILLEARIDYENTEALGIPLKDVVITKTYPSYLKEEQEIELIS